MNINIYQKYRIVIKGSYAYRVGYDEFCKEIIDEDFVADVCRVFEMISRWFADRYINFVDFQEDEIIVSTFNPDTGEFSEFECQFFEVENER